MTVEGASVDAMLDATGEFRVLTLLPPSPIKPGAPHNGCPQGSQRTVPQPAVSADADGIQPGRSVYDTIPIFP